MSKACSSCTLGEVSELLVYGRALTVGWFIYLLNVISMKRVTSNVFVSFILMILSQILIMILERSGSGCDLSLMGPEAKTSLQFEMYHLRETFLLVFLFVAYVCILSDITILDDWIKRPIKWVSVLIFTVFAIITLQSEVQGLFICENSETSMQPQDNGTKIDTFDCIDESSDQCYRTNVTKCRRLMAKNEHKAFSIKYIKEKPDESQTDVMCSTYDGVPSDISESKQTDNPCSGTHIYYESDIENSLALRFTPILLSIACAFCAISFADVPWKVATVGHLILIVVGSVYVSNLKSQETTDTGSNTLGMKPIGGDEGDGDGDEGDGDEAGCEFSHCIDTTPPTSMSKGGATDIRSRCMEHKRGRSKALRGVYDGLATAAQIKCVKQRCDVCKQYSSSESTDPVDVSIADSDPVTRDSLKKMQSRLNNIDDSILQISAEEWIQLKQDELI